LGGCALTVWPESRTLNAVVEAFLFFEKRQTFVIITTELLLITTICGVGLLLAAILLGVAITMIMRMTLNTENSED
jgi:hypothetical protein